jgi:hypothetical protein
MLAICLTSVGFWTLRSGDGKTVEAREPKELSETSGKEDLQEFSALEASHALASKRAVEAAPQRPLSDAELMVEEYFGSDASLVLAALREKGIDMATLPAPVPQVEFESFLPNWMAFSEEERLDKHRQFLEWPEQLTNDYIRANFQLAVDLSAEDLAGLDQLASLYVPEIEVAIDGYLDNLEVAMSMELAMGRVRTSPFLTWPQGRAAANDAFSGTPFFSLVRAGQGWVANVCLWTGEHPEAVLARETLQRAIHTRDEDLATSIGLLQ